MRFKNGLKKTALCLLALVFACSAPFTTPAFAASSVSDLEQEKKELQEKINDKQKELKKFKEEKKETEEYLITLTASMDLLREKINVLQKQIDDLQAQISAKENEIAALEQQIEVKQKEFDAKKEEYYERLRLLYVSGSVSNLEVLLSSSDFASLLASAELVSAVSKQDQQALDELMEAMEAIQKDQAQLEADKKALVASQDTLKESRSELDTQQAALQADYNESKAVANALQANIDHAEEEIDDSEEARQKLQQEINSILNPPNSNGPIITPGDGITTGVMTHPCPGRLNVSVYWPRYASGKWHGGVDFACGTTAPPIYAADGGVVVQAGWSNTGYGNYVMIYHSNGLYTLYGHASAVYVTAGQTVTKGQQIARVGSTGNSTGNHLHFEVRYGSGTSNRETYDPAAYLPYL